MADLNKLSTVLELFRRLIVSVLALILSMLLIIFFIRSSFRKQVIIQPFKISGSSLTAKGYSGELLTALFVRRIREIQDTGSSLYHANKVVIPSWDDKLGNFDVAFANSSFGDIRSLLTYFGAIQSEVATGEIAEIDTEQVFLFKVDDLELKIRGKQIDEVLNQAAEAVVEKIDPYALAAYSWKIKDDIRCLQIAERLLNGDSRADKGLANHLRGLAYLQMCDTPQAKEAFLEALKDIKAKWITYSNLGLIYENADSDAVARQMFNKAIALNSTAYYAYLNFANLLYKEYGRSHHTGQLDSAIRYYKKAIERDKPEYRLYIALLPALYDKPDTTEASIYRRKLWEMDNKNYLLYFQMARIYDKLNYCDEAQVNYILAERYCPDSAMRRTIEDSR
jgi:tetratricopeptide (TPR) repeat protein